VRQLPAAARGLQCGSCRQCCSCRPRPGGWTAVAAGRGPGAGLRRPPVGARGLDCCGCRPLPGGWTAAAAGRGRAAARGLDCGDCRPRPGGWPRPGPGAGLRFLPAVSRGLDCGGCRLWPGGLDCGGCRPRPGGWTAAAAGRGRGAGLRFLPAVARGLDCGGCRPRPGGWTAAAAGRRLDCGCGGGYKLWAAAARWPAAQRAMDCDCCRPRPGGWTAVSAAEAGGPGPGTRTGRGVVVQSGQAELLKLNPCFCGLFTANMAPLLVRSMQPLDLKQDAAAKSLLLSRSCFAKLGGLEGQCQSLPDKRGFAERGSEIASHRRVAQWSKKNNVAATEQPEGAWFHPSERSFLHTYHFVAGLPLLSGLAGCRRRGHGSHGASRAVQAARPAGRSPQSRPNIRGIL